MASSETIGESMQRNGVSRRTFLQFCSTVGAMLALPASTIAEMTESLGNAKRPSVIWMSFQECTGCTEALLRSHAPSLESLIFDFISLDYHHTLQAASGHAAEHAREQAMHAHKGEYIVIVDGSIPMLPGTSTIAGIDNKTMLMNTVKDAAAIISVGTCAAYGGIPKAKPNPTQAVSVADLVTDKPIVNLPGCPPMPLAISGVIAHFLTLGRLPELDNKGRPLAFFGENIHDRCYRRPFYDRGEFAHTFDDEGARKGWCLYKLGCKAPIAYNACATLKWNQSASFPIQSGHGCIGCSEPDFWDQGGIYESVARAQINPGVTIGAATAAGAAIGFGSGLLARRRQHAEKKKETEQEE